MSLFSNDMRVANTATPSFAKEANVGQFGWTNADAAQYNQLIQYVDECRKIWINLEEKIDYVEELLVNVENIDGQVKYMELMTNEVSKWRNEVISIRDQMQTLYDRVYPLYEDFIVKYPDVVAKHTDVVKMHDETEQAAIAAAQSESGAKNWYDMSKDIYDDLKEGQVYRGTWNPKTQAYPPHEGTNSVWDVVLDIGVTEVSYDGKVWRSGDRLLYVVSASEYQQLQTGGGVESVNGKTGAVTITADDLGAVNKAGDIMTGALFWENDSKYISQSDQNLHLAAKNGTAYIESKLNPIARVSGSDYNFYHQGFKPTANEIGALEKTGDTITGGLVLQDGNTANLTLNNNYVKGANNAIIMRDHGNGNVTLCAGVNSSGVAGQLYLGYNAAATGTAGYNTATVRLDSPMAWKSSHTLIDSAGKINVQHITNAVATTGGTMTAPLHWIDANKYLNASGDNMYIAAKLGRVYIEGNSTPIARVAGIDYNMYHQGFKPTAADVGALPVGTTAADIGALPTGTTAANIGGVSTTGNSTINGNISVVGDITSRGGLTITGSGNVQAMHGGFLRTNTDSVMSLDGKVYSFVTSPRDAHLCYNSYWDGASWRKYDTATTSGYFVVKEEGLQYFFSDAGSDNPNQRRANVITTATSGFTDASNFMVAESANGWVINNHELLVHKFPGGAHVKGIIRRSPAVGKTSDIILRFYQNVRMPYAVYHLDQTTSTAPMGWSYTESRNFDGNTMTSGGWNENTGWIMVDFMVQDSQ